MAEIAPITQKMEPTYNGEATSVVSSVVAGEIEMAAVYIKRGYVLAKTEDKPTIEKLECRIAELERENKLLRDTSKIIKLYQDAPPNRNYDYNYALFPKDNGNVIIDSVIELAKCKRECDKYIIVNKTDWYLVYMVLHYFGLFTGKDNDFLKNILPNVLKYLDDPERIEQLSANSQNFYRFKKEHPIGDMPVDFWGKLLKKEREKKEENEQTSHQITVIDRGYNIKMKLHEILIHHGVQLDNH